MEGLNSCALTFELTGPLRRDGLARAGKMYRVPQTGPRQPAVAGPVVQRGIRHQRDIERNGAFMHEEPVAVPSQRKSSRGNPRLRRLPGTLRGPRRPAALFRVIAH